MFFVIYNILLSFVVYNILSFVISLQPLHDISEPSHKILFCRPLALGRRHPTLHIQLFLLLNYSLWSNLPYLNPAKPEFIVLSLPDQTKKIPDPSKHVHPPTRHFSLRFTYVQSLIHIYLSLITCLTGVSSILIRCVRTILFPLGSHDDSDSG